jgi:hypothetical protein
MITKQLYTTILLLFIASRCLFAGITVSESNEQRLAFSFSLDSLSIQSYIRGDTRFSDIRFDGKNSEVREPGGVVVPTQSLYAGVPPQGEVSVTFTATETRRITLDYPLPVASETAGPVFVDPWISEPDYLTFRGYRSAALFIRPCRYDPTDQSATLLIRATCVITFPPSPVSRSAGSATSDYEAMLSDLMINWSVTRRWSAAPGRPVARAMARQSLFSGATVLGFTVGDGNSGVNESTTSENGLVKISGSTLIAAFGAPIAWGDLSLFAAPKEALDAKVPESALIPAGIIEIPILPLDRDRNGRVDNQDTLYAYVSATADWVFDTATHDFVFRNNRFEGNRHYWLSITGHSRTLAIQRPPATSTTDTITAFVNHVMYRQAKNLQTGYDGATRWVWQKLERKQPKFEYTLGLSNLIADSSGQLTVYPGARVGDSTAYYMGTTILPPSGSFRYRVSAWSSTNLTAIFTNRESDGNGYFEIEQFSVKALQRISMKGLQRLEIFGATTAGIHTYRLDNLPPERCLLLRIPPDEASMTLVDTIPAKTVSYTWTDSGSGIRYYACALSASALVDTVEVLKDAPTGEYGIRDLRAANPGAEFCIITHPDFINEAVRLAVHKIAIGRFSAARIVLIDDIYRQFSGGNRDPAAVRNFLVNSQSNWTTKPDYVLLMGNGHYDYKEYKSRLPSFIPPYEEGPGCWDDFYATLGAGESVSSNFSTPDLFIGRLPAESAADAAVMVDKIIAFEGPAADRGSWRNTALLVADDDMQQGEHDRIVDSKPHHVSSEEVEAVMRQCDPALDIRKVYLYEYEWDAAWEKPAASQAISNAINSGVLLVNFFGHGSNNVWADEHVLRNETIGRLRNGPRYPLVSSFSCSVGRFDIPGEECLSGALVAEPGGGAIAAVSGTRPSGPIDNTELARRFYAYLCAFTPGFTIGQALCRAKQDQRDFNQKSYSLLGDPSLRVAVRTDTVALEILDDASGLPIDTLQAMQVVRVRGTIRQGPDVDAGFGTPACSAWVQLGLFNPQQDSVQRKDMGADRSVRYRLPGRPVFIGSTAVHGGRFDQRIFLPRRLEFNKPGVVLNAYAWSPDSAQRNVAPAIGKGYTNTIIFSGTRTNSIHDTIGPRISVRTRYDDPGMTAGALSRTALVVMPPADFEIALYDENGIDVVGTGPDEGLTLEVPGGLSRRNINHTFVFAEGDFRSGTALYTLNRDDLKAGEYSLVVCAQDLLGNKSCITIQLTIVADEEFSLASVFNYPNPVKMGEPTRFFFSHSNPHANNTELPEFGTVRVMIKIYTLSGRLVRVIRDAANGQLWDGADERGRALGPNVYLYQVSGIADFPLAKKQAVSPVKKLVIYPPR